MASWTDLSTTELYAALLARISERDVDAARQFDPATATSFTNPKTSTIRWRAAIGRWEIYNGSTWVDLAATYTINISGSAGSVPFSGITGKPATLLGYGITDGQPLDTDLTALAALASTAGMLARTGAGAFAVRTLTAPAAGITISNNTGAAGNPTLALANDLNALEGLASTGFAARIAADSWAQRTLTAGSTKITITNGNGVSGNPTVDVNEANFATAILKTLVDAKGDLIVATAADTVARVAVGSNGQVLTADSTQASGVKWADNSGFTTGDAKITFKTTADAGWVMMNDGSIGSAASGATTRANADTQALYTLLWTNITNTWAPVSGGRGASAAADFSANKTLTLPKALGRALAVAGAGSGLTSRALGQNLGAETHLLTGTESGTAAHNHSASGSFTYSQAGGGATTFVQAGTDGLGVDAQVKGVSVTVNNSASSSAASAHNNMPPETFLNVMIKL